MKKIIALLLCLVMMLSLCACGSSEIVSYEDGESAGLGYAAYPGDTIVGTVNGEDVTWMEYFYWLNYYVMYVQQLAASYGVTLSSWDAYELSPGDTNAQVVLMNAQYMIAQHHAVNTKAAELGIALDEEDLAMVEEIYELNADQAIGDADGVCTEEELAAFEEYLTQQYVDGEFFDYLNEISILSEKLYMETYGEAGANLSDEDVIAYAKDNTILSAKHILLLTQDATTGEALTEDEIAAKKTQIEDLLTQLQAVSGDLVALEELFDQLAAEYTEDTGYAYYPEGYIFGEGEMVAEFENTVKELDESYGLSGVVETDYGYHIILRIPTDPEGIVGTDSNGNDVNMRSAVASNLFNADMAAWAEGAEAVWNEGFETLDLTEIFG